MTATATATVYGVFTLGTDYYDTEWVLFNLYADAAAAEAKASELRVLKAEYGSDEDELEYDAVKVDALTVL